MKVLGICGSLRGASTNRLLLGEARRVLGDVVWAEGDLRLPLYDGDLEAGGMPAQVLALAGAVRDADAVVIACPEYNKGLPGVLKNALDWVSRVPGAAFAGKPVAIVSAAAGRSGGERAQYALRLCLVPLRARVLSAPEVMVADSSKAFDAAGRLTDAFAGTLLADLMDGLRAEVTLVNNRRTDL